jgi:hypothetical protein
MQAETLPKFYKVFVFGPLGLEFLLHIMSLPVIPVKRRKHNEEATHSAIRVGTNFSVGGGGVRARVSCQVEGGALGR